MSRVGPTSCCTRQAAKRCAKRKVSKRPAGKLGRWAAPMQTSRVISVATLHLMVGLPCSGKTTFAQKLELDQSALRLTTDEWHVRLFGQDPTEPEHDTRHGLIEAMLWNIASRTLILG